MSRIFDLEPGDYLITDESSLCDFSNETDVVRRKIMDVYGIDVSDVTSGNLLEIVVRFHEMKRRDEI
jgi:hypothetical protein